MSETCEQDGANESFERAASAFYKATGRLAPGKNGCDHSYETEMAWRAWSAAIVYYQPYIAAERQAKEAAEADNVALRKFLEYLRDTSDARYATYTNRDAAEIADRKWNDLIDRLMEFVRPLLDDSHPGSALLDELGRLREIVGELRVIDCDNGYWRCRWCGQESCDKDTIAHITGCPVEAALASKANAK